ncbi:MAG: hypothetical protein ACRD2G_00645, partial [Terriglobia bacterium]
MLKILSNYAAGLVLLAAISSARQAPAPSARPAARIVGTVTAVNKANQSITVKQDKTGTEYTAQLAGTKTILSVPPGTKPGDLKKA